MKNLISQKPTSEFHSFLLSVENILENINDAHFIIGYIE